MPTTVRLEPPATSEERLRAERLRLVLVACSVTAGAFAVLFLVAALLTPAPSLTQVTLVICLLLGFCALAWRLYVRGRLGLAASVVGLGIIQAAIGSCRVAPFAYPTFVLMALEAVVCVLPYARGRLLQLVLLASYVAIVVITAFGTGAAPPTGWPAWLSWTSVVVGVSISGGLCLIMLWQDALRMDATLEGLREAVHRTEAALAARDEFLSIAAHELRTPLTALGLQIQNLQRGVSGASRPPTQEQLAARLTLATQHVQRFQKLIDGLLDVSRIVDGRLSLELELIDLAGVVTGVAARLEESAARANAPLVLRAPCEVKGRWDRLRLEQIVTNLLSNAIKFGAGHPIEIATSGSGDDARLEVRDHGIGIALGDQPRIFERFERAVPTTSYGGLGLGLWITRRIVEALGGQIRVESEVNAGAAFIVDLPTAGPPASPPAA